MKNILNIENNTKFKLEFRSKIKKALDEFAIFFNEKKPISVDLNIINNAKMRKIHFLYKNKNKSTDVLSFPSNMNDLWDFINIYPLGEIFISYEKIISQAKKYNHSIKREFLYLFVHGLVHLKGYDHLNNEDEDLMNNIVETIMDKINVRRTN